MSEIEVDPAADPQASAEQVLHCDFCGQEVPCVRRIEFAIRHHYRVNTGCKAQQGKSTFGRYLLAGVHGVFYTSCLSR